MGMTVKDYECITFYNFNIKMSGFSNSRTFTKSLVRHHAYLGFKSITGDNKLTLEQFWSFEAKSKKRVKKDYSKLLSRM